MKNIVKLFLSKDRPQKLAEIQEAALSIYAAAVTNVESKIKQGGEYGPDQFIPELMGVLEPMLSGENLADSRHYQKLKQSIEAWETTEPIYCNAEEKAREAEGLRLRSDPELAEVVKAKFTEFNEQQQRDRSENISRFLDAGEIVEEAEAKITWDKNEPLSRDDEKEHQEAQLLVVKSMLMENLLPKLREQQLLLLQRERLWKECIKYSTHLAAVLEKENVKVKPNQETLTLVRAKERLMHDMREALCAKEVPVGEQIDNFRNLLTKKENRQLLETRRDPTESKLVNSILSLLSKAANFLGFWNTEGGNTAKRMASALKGSEPNEAGSKSVRRKQG